MKKRIMSSLCAMAIMAYASLSWGVSATIENYSENFNMDYSSSLGLTLGARSSSVTDTATVNGTTVGTSTQPGPSAASGLGTVVTGNTMIQGNSTVAEGSPSVTYGNPSAPGGVDVYALSAGIVAVGPWANANPLLPDHAKLLSVATFRQDFTTTAAGVLTLTGSFRNFWQGDATSIKGLWTNTFTLYSVAGVISTPITTNFNFNTILSTGPTLTQSGTYDGVNNGYDVNYLFSAQATLLPGTYAWDTSATIDAGDPVPEPSTFVLAGSGLLGLFLLRRRSGKQA
jgi:PEP-CTERM motif